MHRAQDRGKYHRKDNGMKIGFQDLVAGKENKEKNKKKTKKKEEGRGESEV